MGKLLFDINGRPVRQEQARNLTLGDYTIHKSKKQGIVLADMGGEIEKTPLKTADSLEFLKDEEVTNDNSLNNISSNAVGLGISNGLIDSSSGYWSLYTSDNGVETNLVPLKFTNNKTQEDVVKEVVDLSKQHKVIFIHGTCGSGKSAIALNIARVLGKSSIVVPVKALQRQYEEDYITKKYLRRSDGKKMKIAMITGRENHDSIIRPGISCADPSLPENIKITEKNYGKILEYARQNPFIHNANALNLQGIRRATIAASNPYWSPILPVAFELKALTDARKRLYRGVDGNEYVFHHRKRGCSYYDQYLAYFDADVTIFNSAKYRAELSLGRKPVTKVDIIDEADEFLDEFFQQEELNLSRVLASARGFYPDSNLAQKSLEKIRKLIELEEQNKRATGIREDDVFPASQTKIKELLQEFISGKDLEAEIVMDELSYLNEALETAKTFEHSLDSLYLTYRKNDEGNILIKLVSTDISGKFKDLMNKSKNLVFMSGTLHSENIIKNIFGIEDFKIVQAEELNFGSTEIITTGKEFDCKYSNFSSNKKSRKDYLMALSECISKAKPPVLIHVNAFKDLPTEEEISQFSLQNLESSESLKANQREDKEGLLVSNFKKGKTPHLFTTKCSRGIDFPGEMCNSIIFTKYPNPNVSDTFWKVLQKTHPDYYWEFYRDKAWRGFLQRIYRALRSPTDHVKVLSPDTRVLEQVRKLQGMNQQQKLL